MSFLVGEYECKLDNKGRFILPAGLKRQIPEENSDRFVILLGYEKCLTLYTRNEFDKRAAELVRLSEFSEDNRNFVRLFLNGAIEMVLDSSMRLLLPKRLQEEAGIDKDIILQGVLNKIEIWPVEVYKNIKSGGKEDLSALAKKLNM